MLRGLYTAAAGMMAQMVDMDISANNVANLNTIGFKRDRAAFQSFPEMMIQRVYKGAKPIIGAINTGAAIAGSRTDFLQGGVRTTGNPLDVALQGPGFFTVKKPDGELAYTRNGSFTLDQQGFLVTQDGLRVQGQAGDIQIPPGQSIEITKNGGIVVGGQPIDSLKITQFGNAQGLRKQGEALFLAPPGVAEDPAPKPYTVVQRALELPNINPVSEMVGSIVGMRIYESLEKSIRMTDDTLKKVVNEVGKGRA